jgi:hypothetical protein
MPKRSIPANTIPLPALTRRGLLVGTATAAASTVLPAEVLANDPRMSAQAGVDAELAALGRTLTQALETYEAARRHHNRCEKRFLATCPDPPDLLTSNGPLGRLLPNKWSRWNAQELRWLLKDSGRRRFWRKARVLLPIAKAYEAQVRRVERDSGWIAAEAAHEAAIDALDDLSQKILAGSARSSAGLAVKARAVKLWGKPEWWDPIAGRADTHERLAAQILDAAIKAGQAADDRWFVSPPSS